MTRLKSCHKVGNVAQCWSFTYEIVAQPRYYITIYIYIYIFSPRCATIYIIPTLCDLSPFTVLEFPFNPYGGAPTGREVNITRAKLYNLWKVQ